MKNIDAEKSINEILKNLRDKERDILGNRFGLFGEKNKTLAAIGKDLGLTRERIRQIQNSSLNKIKDSDLQNQKIFTYIQKTGNGQGGLISAKDLVSKLKINHYVALFLLEAAKDLRRIKGQKSLIATFINKGLKTKDIIKTEKELIDILKKKQKALSAKKLIELCQNSDIPGQTIRSLLFASSAFAFDWKGRIGLSVWREINPKSARDKSYFILKKEERPLHFTHIAELISKENFVGKNPTAATVHNELILDQRFVLVGRGIYALAEWGFKGGTVEDVIADILTHHPKGLGRDTIIEEVLKTKLVARNTVMMNLLVKKQFKRDNKGLYKLAK